jgi:hypothetical protein
MVPDTDIPDLLSRAPELMKNGAALVSALKVTQFFQALFGKATDQVADQLAVEVRRWCLIRQLQLFAKVQQMLKDAGLKPGVVSPKTLFPLLEGAALEEDENLHDMWAALLANASSPDGSKVRPGFIATLKQMAPDEARLLSLMLDRRCGRPGVNLNDPFDVGELMEAHQSVQIPGDSDPFSYHACVQTLHSEQLIEPLPDPENFRFQIKSYALTMRGLAFVIACRPPKAKENG